MPKGLRSLARSMDKVPFVPVTAVLFGMVAGILMLATPVWLFERNVVASGLPDIVSAAAPPLGDKAQIMAAIVSALATACLLWLVPTMLGRLVKANRAKHEGIESESEHLERPLHPETSGRRPLFAESDLGAPFMSDEAIAHARDQLVLDASVANDPESQEQFSDEAALDLAEQFEEPTLQSPSETPALAAIVGEQTSIAGLLDRLESALERREHHTDSTTPILPGDMAALRKILGESTARH